MSMICNKCKRVVTEVEFSTYAIVHFGKYLLANGLAIYLVKKIEEYFSTRTLLGETIAGAANAINMECPDCKTAGSWDPL